MSIFIAAKVMVSLMLALNLRSLVYDQPDSGVGWLWLALTTVVCLFFVAANIVDPDGYMDKR